MHGDWGQSHMERGYAGTIHKNTKHTFKFKYRKQTYVIDKECRFMRKTS